MASMQNGAARRYAPSPLVCVCAVFALIGSLYAAGPFLTLWRIAQAVERGDVATLQAMIDWTSVRQGLKDDITEGIIGMPQQRLVASNTLPPFGTSFISGIAATAIDRAISPPALIEMSRLLADTAESPPGSLWPSLVRAAFKSPTSFDLHLLVPCQAPEEEPLHVRLVFRQGSWVVVRVWVPQDLMDRAGTRT